MLTYTKQDEAEERPAIFPIPDGHCDKCGKLAPVAIIKNKAELAGLLCHDVCYPEWRELIILAKLHDYPWRFNQGKFEIEIIEYSERSKRIYYGDAPSSVWVEVSDSKEFRIKTGY